MSERHQEHNERHERGEQSHHELEHARREKLEALRNGMETPDDDAKERAEAARDVIHQQDKAPEPVATPEDSAPKSRLAFLDHKLNYADTLASVQRRLAPVSRSFSKVIHTPIVEKTSETLEKTVARPSVTLGATWTALIVGSLFYFVARYYGYTLSGSELLFSFIVGALIGLAIEGILRTLRHH